VGGAVVDEVMVDAVGNVESVEKTTEQGCHGARSGGGGGLSTFVRLEVPGTGDLDVTTSSQDTARLGEWEQAWAEIEAAVPGAGAL